MSNVTAATLIVSSAEQEEYEDGPLVNVQAINAWLTEQGLPTFADLTAHYGGSKHPQVQAFGVAFNGFDEEDLEAFFLGLRWQFPDDAVLLLHGESNFRVIRVRQGAIKLGGGPISAVTVLNLEDVVEQAQ